MSDTFNLFQKFKKKNRCAGKISADADDKPGYFLTGRNKTKIVIRIFVHRAILVSMKKIKTLLRRKESSRIIHTLLDG